MEHSIDDISFSKTGTEYLSPPQFSSPPDGKKQKTNDGHDRRKTQEDFVLLTKAEDENSFGPHFKI